MHCGQPSAALGIVLAGLSFAIMASAQGVTRDLRRHGLTCHAAPRGRPVKMGPVDTGPQSVEATRRQLEGAWELVKLETYPAPGKVVPSKPPAG